MNKKGVERKMEDLILSYTAHPKKKEIEVLTAGLNEDVEACGIKEKRESFGFFLRDKDGVIVAGCNGFFIFGSIYVDKLWVSKIYRKKGLGKRLLYKIHALGKEKGCKISTLFTMNFQGAEEFYEKIGYTTYFRHSGYVGNSQCLFMVKDLV